jgi:hypothetical protein
MLMSAIVLFIISNYFLYKLYRHIKVCDHIGKSTINSNSIVDLVQSEINSEL